MSNRYEHATLIPFDQIKNTRIAYVEQLVTPPELLSALPLPIGIQDFVVNTRMQISNIIKQKDHRMLFVVGPCSIHNISEAKQYGRELKCLADKVSSQILIVMRVYLEKPRTTVGWKGLVNDPHLDNSCDVNNGLARARELLLYLNGIGLPCAYEILDTITPQYICDLISWGAIGARTTESQVHRQLVSGLSMPVGFKNGTDGSVKVAADAVASARVPHCFIGITDAGNPAIHKTLGNDDCHVILRGGAQMPNYDAGCVQRTQDLLQLAHLPTSIVIDCSHGNSQKISSNQPIVLDDVIRQRLRGNKSLVGVMLESNLCEGNQQLTTKSTLKAGVSITDSCIDIQTTSKVIIAAMNHLEM